MRGKTNNEEIKSEEIKTTLKGIISEIENHLPPHHMDDEIKTLEENNARHIEEEIKTQKVTNDFSLNFYCFLLNNIFQVLLVIDK